MRNLYFIFILLSLVFGCIFTSFSQNIIVQQSNEKGIYNVGEKIEITVLLEGIETDSILVNVIKNYSSNPAWRKMKYSGEKQVLFEGSFNEPASMIFEVRAGDKYAGTGFVVNPDKIEPTTKRPDDFDEFWENEKKALKDFPLKISNIPVENIESGFVCSDVEINCTGSKPARGYFAKPEKAEPKSLPIVLFVRAAGVRGNWCQSKPEEALNYAKMGNGALCFDLNAHGMLNGQPQQYYDELEAGELKNYWEMGVESRDEFYFKGMYLRLMRTLDFLCSQPEWDGKRILVIGESQGGGQALVAAGLDHRVTAVVATVPAMCDFGSALQGNIGGWPNPFSYEKNKEKMLNTLPYFDAVHILKNSNATLVTEIGLIDITCPSVGIYAAINQTKGEKITLAVPYRGHHQNQPVFQKIWEEDVNKVKMDFIAEFLK